MESVVSITDFKVFIKYLERAFFLHHNRLCLMVLGPIHYWQERVSMDLRVLECVFFLKYSLFSSQGQCYVPSI